MTDQHRAILLELVRHGDAETSDLTHDSRILRDMAEMGLIEQIVPHRRYVTWRLKAGIWSITDQGRAALEETRS